MQLLKVNRTRHHIDDLTIKLRCSDNSMPSARPSFSHLVNNVLIPIYMSPICQQTNFKLELNKKIHILINLKKSRKIIIWIFRL